MGALSVQPQDDSRSQRAPVKFGLTINFKTAKALGLELQAGPQ
jgi:hypothetical protein